MKFALALKIIFFAGCASVMKQPDHLVITENFRLENSAYLPTVSIGTVYLPSDQQGEPLPLVILFDGQNTERLGLEETLTRMWADASSPRFAVAALVAGGRRMDYYGVPGVPDYLGRGALAASFADFLEKELLPYLESRFTVSRQKEQRFLAGFSLTGLGAAAIAIDRPQVWGGAAAMSGSFWWRSGEDAQASRILHNRVRGLSGAPTGRFWFSAGDREEEDDRDGDGVIDAVDDTLDLIGELKAKGVPDERLFWQFIPGGNHSETTWADWLEPMFLWLLAGPVPVL